MWAVPALVVPTMADMANDVPVDQGAPALPSPLILTMVSAPATAAPVVPAVRADPASSVAPMAAAAFAVAVAPAAPVWPASAPTTPVATSVALPVAPAVPAVGPSSSDAMVRDKKRVLYLLFTCLIVSLR